MKAEHIAPFDAIIRNSVGVDSDVQPQVFDKVTIMNIDTAPVEILPYLAVMFGVDGYKGFDYATTEALKRRTLKNAFLMKRRHGTPWAIKTALENAGYRNVVINDHLPKRFWNGSIKFDGSHKWDAEHWAHFHVYLEPPVGVLPADVNLDDLRTLINYWKRCCTLCTKIQINQLTITNFGVGSFAPLVWNASIKFDGSNTFSG